MSFEGKASRLVPVSLNLDFSKLQKILDSEEMELLELRNKNKNSTDLRT